MTPRVLACLAVASGAFGITSLAATSSGGVAQADPAWTSGFVGVGADVTQDLWAAYSGASPAPGLGQSNTTFYTPLNAGSANNFLTVESYDANAPGEPTTTASAITTTAGGPAWDRPNTSTEGILALYDDTQGILYEGNPSYVHATVNLTGQLAFAPVRPRSGHRVQGPSRHGAHVHPLRPGRPRGPRVHRPQLLDHPRYPDRGRAGHLVLEYVDRVGDDQRSDRVRRPAHLRLHAPEQPGERHRGQRHDGLIGRLGGGDDGRVRLSGSTAVVQNSGNAFYAAVENLPKNTAAVLPISAGSWESQYNDVALDRSATGRANGVALADIINASSVNLGLPYTATGATITQGPNSGDPAEVPNTTYYQGLRLRLLGVHGGAHPRRSMPPSTTGSTSTAPSRPCSWAPARRCARRPRRPRPTCSASTASPGPASRRVDR